MNEYYEKLTEEEKRIVVGLRKAPTKTLSGAPVYEEREFEGTRVQRYRGPDGWSGWMPCAPENNVYIGWAL